MTTQLDELTVQGAVAPCTVQLSFTDGESRRIEVGPEETVLAAGKAAGYNIVGPVRGGNVRHLRRDAANGHGRDERRRLRTDP